MRTVGGTAVRHAARAGRRPAGRRGGVAAGMSASRCSTARRVRRRSSRRTSPPSVRGLDIPTDQVRLYLVGARARARAPVPPRQVAAAAPADAGHRLRPRHPHRHRRGWKSWPPTSTRRTPRSCGRDDERRADPAEERGAARRPRPPGDHARPDRGLGGCRHGRVRPRDCPSATAIAEAVRRRRAVGGPAERALRARSSVSSCGLAACARPPRCGER